MFSEDAVDAVDGSRLGTREDLSAALDGTNIRFFVGLASGLSVPVARALPIGVPKVGLVTFALLGVVGTKSRSRRRSPLREDFVGELGGVLIPLGRGGTGGTELLDGQDAFA